MKLNINLFILFFISFIIPIDMINGFIIMDLKKESSFSIGQFSKLFLLFLMLVQILRHNLTYFFIIINLILLFNLNIFVNTIYNSYSLKFLYPDIIYTIKILTPIISLFYFYTLWKNNMNFYFKKLTLVFKTSYFFFVFNILLKYINLGHPTYNFGNIGSKGYIFAQNELSGVFTLFYIYISFVILVNKPLKKTISFFLFNLFVAYTMATKTSMISIFIVFLAFLFYKYGSLFSFKKNIKMLAMLCFVLFSIFIFWEIIKVSKVMVRLSYFWDKLDFVSFILSKRNIVAIELYDMYIEKYTFFQKLFGVGYSNYMLLSNNKRVEIDFFDYLFFYGIFISLLFIIVYIVFIFKSFLKYKSYKSPIYFMIMFSAILFFFISNLSGHIHMSSTFGIYVGALYSLSSLEFYQKNAKKVI